MIGWASAIVLISAAIAGGGGPPSGSSRLAAAFIAADADALRRLGLELGAAGLTPAILGQDRAATRGAIAAADHVRDPAGVLPPLRRRAGSADRPLAAAAARAAARAASRLDRLAVGEGDLALATLAAERAAWLALATDAARHADVRVDALEVAARLAAAEGQAPGFELRVLLADREPELRRAALELLPLPLDRALADAVTAALTDADPDVADAARRTLCTGEPARAAPCRERRDAR